MSESPSAKNLVLGLLALRFDLIDRGQLREAMQKWTENSSVPLGRVLVEQSAIDEKTLGMLSDITKTYLAGHDDDAEKSLLSLEQMEETGDLRSSLQAGDIEETLRIACPDTKTDAFAQEGAVVTEKSRYQKLELHAKGGLGEVSRANDIELHRTVALKEIQHRFADDFNSRTRFVREAEITGALEHPGIVPVYGLGKYQDGRPYYAMRFIHGVSLKKACDRFHAGPSEEEPDVRPGEPESSALGLRQLITRFIDVCNAIEYAHSRGFIHRDLKPSNVMLGDYGETLVVDWGLAKPIGEQDGVAPEDTPTADLSGSGSAPTQMGSAIGTPSYMSPEQAAGRLDLLGPASDIYSLGATLYYILTGCPPFAERNLTTLLDKVRAGDFQTPRSVRPEIPRPLAAICLRAMAREADERYESAKLLADDLENWFADEPTVALPEGVVARSARWLRKNRAIAVSGVATSLLVTVISLITAIVVNSYRQETRNHYLTAELERGRALNLANRNEALANAEAAARADAERRQAAAEQAELEANLKRQEADAVSQFLVSAFRSPNPSVDGRFVTIAETLDKAVETLNESFPDSPLTRAALATAIGTTYRGLGLHAEAVGVQQLAFDIRQNQLGDEDQETLFSANELAMARWSSGDHEAARPLFEQTLARRKQVLGAEHPETVASLSNYATVLQFFGEYDQAVELFDEALRIRISTLGARHVDTLVSMNNLALAYDAKGDLQKAREQLEETLQLKEEILGRDHPSTSTTIHNMGHLLLRLHEFEKALPYLEEALLIRKERFGPEHPKTALTIKILGETYAGLEQWDLAITHLRDGVDLFTDSVGRGHVNTLATLDKLAAAYRDAAKLEEATMVLSELVEIHRDSLGDDHAETLTRLNNLGWVLKLTGELDRASVVLTEAFEGRRRVLGSLHPHTQTALRNLSATYQAAERWEEAIPLWQNRLAKLREARQDPGAEELEAFDALARVYRLAGRIDDTVATLEESLQVHQAMKGEFAPDVLVRMNNLGWVHRLAGNQQESRELLERTLLLRKEHLGAESAAANQSRMNLATLYRELDEFDLAIDLYLEVLAIRVRRVGERHSLTLDLRHELGTTHLEAKRFAKAIEILEQTRQARQQTPGSGVLPTLETSLVLATAYRMSGEFDRARTLLQETLRRSAEQLGASHEHTAAIERELETVTRLSAETESGSAEEKPIDCRICD